MKLNRQKLISELQLLAAGANGWEVVLDDDQFANLQSAMNPADLARFATAVEQRWFDGNVGAYTQASRLFGISDIEKWETFETLADAIIEERKRLERVEKMREQKGGE